MTPSLNRENHAWPLDTISVGSPSPFWAISANVFPIGSWEPLSFLASETFWLLPPVTHPPLLHNSVQLPDTIYISISSNKWICSSFHPHILLFRPITSDPLFSLINLFPLWSRTEVCTLLSSFLLSVMWSVSCIMDIPCSLPGIHLSVSTYHVCSLWLSYFTQDDIF